MGEVAQAATLGDLFRLLILAKDEERNATAKRIACEQAILARIEHQPENGRVKLEDGPVRCTVEFKLNYKADVASIRQLEGELPLRRVPETWEFDKRAYEELRKRDPEQFARVAALVETKPAKPAIELKL